MARDVASVLLGTLDWYVSALRHEHGEHGTECWVCNAARFELDLVEEAMAAAIDEMLEPNDEPPVEAAA